MVHRGAENENSCTRKWNVCSSFCGTGKLSFVLRDGHPSLWRTNRQNMLMIVRCACAGGSQTNTGSHSYFDKVEGLGRGGKNVYIYNKNVGYLFCRQQFYSIISRTDLLDMTESWLVSSLTKI